MIRDFFVHFATFSEMPPVWKEFEADSGGYWVNQLETPFQTSLNKLQEQCDFWESNGYFKYSWTGQ